MTNKEAVKMLKAKLKCMERSMSGTDEMCNILACDACDLNYAQGNMGEQKEALKTAIKALEQETVTEFADRCRECGSILGKQKMNNNALWLREKQLERYAQEIKAYCESQNGDCRDCYFGKPPKEDETYPAWDCKFNAEQPEEWEVDG